MIPWDQGQRTLYSTIIPVSQPTIIQQDLYYPFPITNWPRDNGVPKNDVTLRRSDFDSILEWKKAVLHALVIQHAEEQRELHRRRERRKRVEIPESLFDKPTFVRRACGGRWRVMHP